MAERPQIDLGLTGYDELFMTDAERKENKLPRMVNIITDKKEWCNNHGVFIETEDWPCHQLPGVFCCDRGSEYISETFGNICELGPKLTALPSFRPELKSMVAVRKESRGKGLGAAIMNVAEAQVRQMGGRELYLHAQCRITPFYETVGYVPYGGIEDDQGCPHIWMKKVL